MKKLLLALLTLFSILYCNAQTTTYTDRYGNVIGTSTTTNNNLFEGSAVRSNSPPIPPIDYGALNAGYAAREQYHQQRLTYFHQCKDYYGKLNRQLGDCNRELANKFAEAAANYVVDALDNNDLEAAINYLATNAERIQQNINYYCK